MSLTVCVEQYGDDAFEALVRAVRLAQCGDRLAPVTVVVPRGSVGLAARRRLAAMSPGVIGVAHVTLARLAAGLAVPSLAAAGLQPVTGAVVHQAVRRALDRWPGGLLGPARDQPTTVRAVVRTYHELAGVSQTALDALGAQSERAAEVVRIVRTVREILTGRYDDAALVNAAATEARRRPSSALADLGSVVVYLPTALGVPARDLIAALADSLPVTVIVGATGDEVADGPGRQLVEHLAPGTHYAAWSAAAKLGTHVRAAPSADAEVLLALRHLMARNAGGVPLERMALVDGGYAPYPRLVHDVVTRAGIPYNGPGVRPLASTATGRTLLGALELGDHDWRRDDVVTWLASVPIVHDGRPVPAATWDVVSCQAGVVGGLAAWDTRLRARAAGLQRRAASMASGDDRSAGEEEVVVGLPTPETLRRDAASCLALAGFVEDLAQRLGDAPRTWAGWAAWAGRLLAHLLGPPAGHGSWPVEEVAALDAVTEVLDGLAVLDELGGLGERGERSPGAADFRAVLGVELEAPAPQTSRFGRGLFVGRVADVVGLDLDVVYVVGAVDGQLPAPVPDDVLLPDRERRRSAGAGEVPLRGDGMAGGRRDVLAALAGARERVLSYPVGDQRHGRDLRPSRLLLDTLGQLDGGRRLYAGDLGDQATRPELPDDRFVTVPSFAATVAGSGGGTPVSAADWELRSLAGWVRSGARLIDHFAVGQDRVLADALAMRGGHRRGTFTRFDGRLDGMAVPSPASGAVQSATGLESYARCPRRYLLGTLLGVGARERPEEVFRISRLERGTAIHRVLERFVGGELDRLGGAAADRSSPWGPEAERRLFEIAEDVFTDLEARGLTGRAELWRFDREEIVTDLRRFLRVDDGYRRQRGAVPEAVEQRFGSTSAPALTVAVEGTRTVRFKGSIDRVDRTADGGLSVVDYKTGVARPDAAADPVLGGTHLQLLLYALAARREFRPTGPVTAAYWYLARSSAPVGVTLEPGTERRLVEVVGALVDGIEHGRFPANPGEPDDQGRGSNCRLCPFDQACPSDRVRAWQRKRSDPWLAGYRALEGSA